MNLELSSSHLSYVELGISHTLTESSVWTCCGLVNDVTFSLINQIVQTFLTHLKGSNHRGPLLHSLFLCSLFLSFWKCSSTTNLLEIANSQSLHLSHPLFHRSSPDSLVALENFSLFSQLLVLCCQSSSLISICFVIVHHIYLFSSNNQFKKCLVLKLMH